MHSSLVNVAIATVPCRYGASFALFGHPPALLPSECSSDWILLSPPAENHILLWRSVTELLGAMNEQMVELGIRGQRVQVCDHIAYFWESEEEFAEGVGFLETGLQVGDYCVIFGQPEANEKVL